MRKLLFCLVYGLLANGAAAQRESKEMLLSTLFQQQTIQLYKAPFLDSKTATPSDTFKVSFTLINNYPTDTSIYYTEGYNDWFSFTAVPLNAALPAIRQISGSSYYGKIFYDNVYYPAQTLSLKAGAIYRCTMQWKSMSYTGAGTNCSLLTAAAFNANNRQVQKLYYTNNIITYFFTGAIFFGFFLFLFLYYKSRYPLFGMYAAFLFLQGLYGFVLYDVYTLAGSLFITHLNWDEYVTELIVFTGQAIYVQFIIGWLKIKQTSNRLAGIFNKLSLFFAGYAFLFFSIYLVAPQWQGLSYLKVGVRIVGFLFQLFLFYHIYFNIKTPGRWYIFTGNLLLMLLGIVMIFLRSRGIFTNTWLSDIDNASWYMLGVLGENLCFTLGMGQHYFELQTEKNNLQIASLTSRQLQLETQENSLKDRLRISQDLHDNIGSTLSSISVYSQVAKIHCEKNSQEELEELLETISYTSNEMVAEMNDIVWAIAPRNDGMEKIIQRMESFARPLAAARNIIFILDVNTSASQLQLDMERRKNFYLIFKEAVANAIKYSGATTLRVVITMTDATLYLEVADDGVGFNPQAEMAGQSTSLSGNGLRNMQSRAAQLKGQCTITSMAEKGTAVSCSFPLK